MTRRRYVPATKVARVYAGMGDRDNAFRWLEKACDQRDLWLVFLKSTRVGENCLAIRDTSRSADV